MSEYSSFFSEPPLEGPLREDVEHAYEWAKYYQPKIDALRIDVSKALPRTNNPRLSRAMYDCAVSLLMRHRVLGPLRPLEDVPDEELEIFRRLLYSKRYFYENHDYLIGQFQNTLRRMFWFVTDLEHIVAERSPFAMPLYATIPDLPRLIDVFYKETWESGLELFFKLDKAILHTNKMGAEEAAFGKIDLAKIGGPSKTGLTPDAMVETYLARTPFLELLRTPVPLKFSQQERSSHHLICGGSGSGKTSVIEHMLVHDITSAERPSVILIDPHSDLVNRLLNADVGLKDRLVYINPRDVEYPPQLNVFAPNTRMQGYDAMTQEQVSTAAIETFEYLFSGIFDLALTGRQATLLPYLTRLMLAFPTVRNENATLLDVLAVTEDIAPFMDVVNTLDPLEREFFHRDFMSKYKDTRQQIQYRLQAIMGNMTLRRLFGTQETKIDLFQSLNDGAVILIDTSEAFLGSGSALFGRLWVSFILQAILERSAIPEAKRRTTYLYIDEAMTYFDEKLAKMLREVRKYGCSVVLASQELPAGGAVRSALSSSTAIKMACMVGSMDAGSLAPDMRTSREFILAQPRLQFATYIQGVTKRPVPVSVTPGLIASLPKISAEEYEELIAENRRNVSSVSSRPALSVVRSELVQGASTPRPQDPYEDVSRE